MSQMYLTYTKFEIDGAIVKIGYAIHCRFAYSLPFFPSNESGDGYSNNRPGGKDERDYLGGHRRFYPSGVF